MRNFGNSHWSLLPCLMAALITGTIAAKDVSAYSASELRQIREWAQMALNSYSSEGSVAEGYRPSSSFLNSELITHRIDIPDKAGNYSYTVFEIPYVDKNGKECRGLYKFNPVNGQITPWESDYLTQYKRLMGGKTSWVEAVIPSPPDFVAQVLEKDGQLHVVFAGTDSLKDWGENKDQFFGNVPPQFRMADFLTQCVQDTSVGKVTLEGHSEGGGEVQYAVLKSLERGNGDIVGVTFNSQRLSKDVIDDFNQVYVDAAIARIYNFVMNNDAVSGLGVLGEELLGDLAKLGRYCTIGDEEGLCLYGAVGIYRAHAMRTIINRIDELIAAREREQESDSDGGEDSPLDYEPEGSESTPRNAGHWENRQPVGLTPFKTY